MHLVRVQVDFRIGLGLGLGLGGGSGLLSLNKPPPSSFCRIIPTFPGISTKFQGVVLGVVLCLCEYYC